MTDEEPVDHAALRCDALADTLRTIRRTRGWSVADAASCARIAPMTWRRLETSRNVRRPTLIALDNFLGQPIGTVRGALDDDQAMAALRAHVDEVVSMLDNDTPPDNDVDWSGPCADCGFHTAPESGPWEYYSLSDDVWAQATDGRPARFLCVGCVEQRIGGKAVVTHRGKYLVGRIG